MIRCDLDCFNCTKPDCDVDFIDWNSIKCKEWYERNRERKIEYQKAYNKRKRLEKAINPPKAEVPERKTELMSFRDLVEVVDK